MLWLWLEIIPPFLNSDDPFYLLPLKSVPLPSLWEKASLELEHSLPHTLIGR